MTRVALEQWTAFCLRPGNETFEPFFDQSRALVWTICYRILRNNDDAGDAFQRTYARLLDLARDPASPDRALDPYKLVCLYASREADSLSHRRSRRHMREVPMDRLSARADAALPTTALLEHKLLRERLLTLVDLLPDPYRAPVQLHYFHGMTHAEIGRALGRPVGTISNQLRRALKKLEPLMRRAGLADAARLLGALTATDLLLDPPASLAAAPTYAMAESILATGSAATGSLVASAGTLMIGAKMMNAKMLLFKWIAGLGLAAAATGGIVYVVQSDSEPQQTIAEIAPADEAAAPPTAPLPPADEPAPTPPPEKPAAEPAKPATATVAQPEPTPTPWPTPAGPTRELDIYLVWTKTDNPVPDARVTMEDATGGEITWLIEGRTDAQGKLRLRHPEYLNRAMLRIHQEEALYNEYLVRFPAEQEVVIEMRPAGKLFGTVKNGLTGQPVGDADLYLRNLAVSMAWNGGVRLVGKSLPDGSFTIHTNIQSAGGALEGDVSIWAVAGNLRSDSGEQPRFMIKPGEQSGPHELVLQPVPSLTGTVRAKGTRQPVANAQVSTAMYNPRVTYSCSTDALGRFALEGLPKDRWSGVEVTAEGYRRQRTAGNESPLEVELEPGGTVNLAVLDMDDAPVRNAKIGARSVATGLAGLFRNDESAIETQTDDAGLARIQGVGLQDKVSITAEMDGFETGSIEAPAFAPGQTETSLTLVLKPADPGVFAGRVTDRQGRPIANAAVYWPYNVFHPDTVTTEEDGTFVLVVKNRSSESLVVYADGFAPGVLTGIQPGSQDKPAAADFILTPGHTLTGRLVDREGNVLRNTEIRTELDFKRYFWPKYTFTITDQNGVFLIRDLAETTTQVRVKGQTFTLVPEGENKLVIE